MQKQLSNLYSENLSNSALKVIMKRSTNNIITQFQDINIQPFKPKGQFFIDPDFPHLNLSLGQHFQPSEDIHIEWIPVSQLTQKPVYSSTIINTQQLLFSNKIINHALFIIQLFAKQKFKQIVEEKQLNQQGIFDFEVLHQGIIKKVYIDSFIPTISKKQIFAQTYNNSIMPPIVQKLLAKIYGNYENIPSCIVDLVQLQTIYCKEIIPYHKYKQQQLYIFLLEKLRIGSIIFFQTRKSDKIQQLGLIQNYQYAISRIMKIKSEIIIQFLELDDKKWKGKYGKARSVWKLWKQQIQPYKIKLNQEYKENYICCKDLIGVTNKFHILNNTTTYHKGYLSEMKNYRKFNFYTFSVEQDNHIMIRALFRVKCRNSLYIIHEKQLFNRSHTFYKSNSTFCQDKDQNYLQFKLNPGKYHLIIKSQLQNQGVPFTVTYFTSVEPVQLTYQEPQMQILEKSLTNFIRDMNYPKLDINLQLQSYAIVKHLYDSTGLGFIFVNISKLDKQAVIIQINKQILGQNNVIPLNFEAQKYEIGSNVEKIFLFECYWKSINKSIEFPPRNSIKIYLKNSISRVSQIHSISNLQVNSY